MEEKNNDTSVLFDNFGHTPEIFDQGDADGWRWDSSSIWLPVLVVLLILLILVNVIFFIKCARSVKRSLCNAFIDLIFVASGMILEFGARRPAKSAERDSSVTYKTSSTSMEPIDAFRPTPLCCFRDKAHDPSETATGGYDNQVFLTNEDEKKGNVVVEVRVNSNNKTPVVVNGEERENAGERAEGGDRYLVNINANKQTEKVIEKMKPPTVREKASVELGKLQPEDVDASAEPTYATVAKPPRKSDNGDATTPDPEIYI